MVTRRNPSYLKEAFEGGAHYRVVVMAIEALAQNIRRSKMIKGIEIEYYGSQEIKLSQYADDTTALCSYLNC